MDSNGVLFGESLPAGPTIEMVDLGLASGTLWAKYNIGAEPGSTPESWYGNYYAWGEIETKSDYSRNTYKFGASTPFSKYDTDGKTILEAVDDVVTATYGASYRMPTKAQMEELFLLNYQWVTNYKGVTGLNGMLFSDSGKELFIPAAG